MVSEFRGMMYRLLREASDDNIGMIEVDGIMRPIYNSNGDKIAEDEKSLINFWKWFRDSRVVDKQGRPLVMYHGTNKKFTEFDKNRIGRKHKDLYQGKGFYFTSEYYDAYNYGKKLVSVYLRVENPALSTYGLKPKNDGISAVHDVWIVFEPNQIKSVDNNGNWSATSNDIYE